MKQASLFHSRVFVGRNLTGRELKLLYAKRTTCGYLNHKISPKPKVQVFPETDKRRCPEKSLYLMLNFSPTRINFCLRACVCVCVCPREVLFCFSF